MTKLYELLAVSKDKEIVLKNAINDVKKTFTEKTEHFTSKETTLEMFDEARKCEEDGYKEKKEASANIGELLSHVCKELASAVNTDAQIENANQLARQDLIVNGKTIALDVPATALLHIERELKRFKEEIISNIPTLKPGTDWKEEKSIGIDIFTSIKQTNKTEKIVKGVKGSEATKEHPANVTYINVDTVIGKYTAITSCNAYTHRKKLDMLDRLDALISATKKARARANSQEVSKTNIGGEIVKYIKGE
jgi:hypothetical protein